MATKIKIGTRVRVVSEHSIHTGRTGLVCAKPAGYTLPAPDMVFVAADSQKPWTAGLIGPISVNHLEAIPS